MQRHLNRSFGVACIALLWCIVSCSPPDTKSMQALLDKLSHGPEAELGSLIYGYSQASAAAQEVLLTMVHPLRAPTADKHMSIEAARRDGRFTMLSVRVPWPQPTQGFGFKASFQAILVCHQDGRDLLAGYVLPFNDIFHHFSDTDMNSISRLSEWWIDHYGRR